MTPNDIEAIYLTLTAPLMKSAPDGRRFPEAKYAHEVGALVQMQAKVISRLCNVFAVRLVRDSKGVVISVPNAYDSEEYDDIPSEPFEFAVVAHAIGAFTWSDAEDDPDDLDETTTPESDSQAH